MRARNIKPGFFKNDELAALDPLARILFAGLWCLADREGRLEDRPLRIKAEVLPYDSCDVDSLLSSLDDAGFILRYQADGERYIQITHFLKHQNPHAREQASEIPPCPDHDGGKKMPRHNLGSDKAQPRQCRDTKKAQTSPADSLIPDSLIPDSGFSDSGILIPESDHPPIPPEGGKDRHAGPTKSRSGQPGDACPQEGIIALYGKMLPMLPQPDMWGEPRRKKLKAAIKARWREQKEYQTLFWWRNFFQSVRASPFLLGENDRGWQADLEWLMRPTNFAKVIDGKYRVRGRPKDDYSSTDPEEILREAFGTADPFGCSKKEDPIDVECRPVKECREGGILSHGPE
jgi:hypothetical protein